MYRRSLAQGALGGATAFALGGRGTALAQQPATTRIVIPFAAGGPIDLIGISSTLRQMFDAQADSIGASVLSTKRS